MSAPRRVQALVIPCDRLVSLREAAWCGGYRSPFGDTFTPEQAMALKVALKKTNTQPSIVSWLDSSFAVKTGFELRVEHTMSRKRGRT